MHECLGRNRWIEVRKVGDGVGVAAAAGAGADRQGAARRGRCRAARPVCRAAGRGGHRAVYQSRDRPDGSACQENQTGGGGFAEKPAPERAGRDGARSGGRHAHQACQAGGATRRRRFPRVGRAGSLHAGQHLHPCPSSSVLLRSGRQRGSKTTQAGRAGDRWFGVVEKGRSVFGAIDAAVGGCAGSGAGDGHGRPCDALPEVSRVTRGGQGHGRAMRQSAGAGRLHRGAGPQAGKPCGRNSECRPEAKGRPHRDRRERAGGDRAVPARQRVHARRAACELFGPRDAMTSGGDRGILPGYSCHGHRGKRSMESHAAPGLP